MLLVVVAGLPGTGKSTLADAIGRHFRAPVFSVDPIEAAIWRSGIARSFETGLAAYEVAATLAEHEMHLGISVVVDAVSSVEIARAMWRSAARRAGAEIRIIEVVCTDERLHRKRLEARQRDIAGFYEPTWASVQERRDEYEPWSDDRLILDTIAALDDNLATAFAYVEELPAK
jgi:predicted kinase